MYRVFRRSWLWFWRTIGGRAITLLIFGIIVPVWWWDWWSSGSILRFFMLLGATLNGVAVLSNGLKMPVETASEWFDFPEGGTWRHKAMTAKTRFKILCDHKALLFMSIGDLLIFGAIIMSAVVAVVRWVL